MTHEELLMQVMQHMADMKPEQREQFVGVIFNKYCFICYNTVDDCHCPEQDTSFQDALGGQQ